MSIGDEVGKQAADEIAKTSSEIVGQLNVRLLEFIQLGKDFKASVDRFTAVLERMEKKLADTGIVLRF